MKQSVPKLLILSFLVLMAASFFVGQLLIQWTPQQVIATVSALSMAGAAALMAREHHPWPVQAWTRTAIASAVLLAGAYFWLGEATSSWSGRPHVQALEGLDLAAVAIAFLLFLMGGLVLFMLALARLFRRLFVHRAELHFPKTLITGTGIMVMLLGMVVGMGSAFQPTSGQLLAQQLKVPQQLKEEYIAGVKSAWQVQQQWKQWQVHAEKDLLISSPYLALSHQIAKARGGKLFKGPSLRAWCQWTRQRNGQGGAEAARCESLSPLVSAW